MFRAPTQTPPVSVLLDDMPTRSLKHIARHLGLSDATVRRYARTGSAPRLVHLALFWETRWGLSVLDCEIVNRDRLRLGHIGALERENKALKAQLARLAGLASGAANEPLYRVNFEGAGSAGLDGLADVGQDQPPPQLQLPLLSLM